MPDFTRESNYKEETSFSKVVFGSSAPVLEVELNEVQDIINTKLKRLFNLFSSEGYLYAPNDVGYDSGSRTLTLDQSVVISGDLLAYVADVSFTVPEEHTVVYIALTESTITGEDVIYSYGNTKDGEVINNPIYDNRLGEETSRRKVINYTVSSGTELPTDTEEYKYIHLATIDEYGAIVEKIITQPILEVVKELPNLYAEKHHTHTVFPGTITANGSLVVTEGRLEGSTVGNNSVAIGFDNTASDHNSIAIGFDNTSSDNNSIAIGFNNTASNSDSIAIGFGNTSSGRYSFVAGGRNSAMENYSIALGDENTAESAGVAIGERNTASNRAVAIGTELNNDSYSAFVCGRYNNSLTANTSESSSTTGDVFAIGNGTGGSSATRSNAFRVTYTGAVYGQGAYNTSGADYAEFVKPWFDNNPDNEDRVGYFVTLKDGYLHKANDGDYILGVTSGNPSVVGNSDEDYYWKYARDEFNRYIYEDVEEEIQTTDDEGNLLYDEDGNPIYEKTGNIIKNGRIKLSNNYDPTLQDSYIERAKRPEWDYVGMRGIIPVRDDGTCEAGGFCKCGADGIATKSETRGFDTYFVIERISDNVVSIEVK